MSKSVENSLLPLESMQTPFIRCMGSIVLVTVVASIAILILGTLGVYGPVGSPGFFASTTTGSTIAFSYLDTTLIYVIYRLKLNQRPENTQEINDDNIPETIYTYLPFESLRTNEEIQVNPVAENLPMADEAIHLAVRSKNKPKPEEKEKYDHLVKNPALLPEKAKKFLRNLHITRPFIEIAPAFNTQTGVCHGACVFFLADYLKHRNLTATMKKFQGGVPIEGVTLQNIYIYLFESSFQLEKSIFLHLLEIFENSCAASDKNLTFSKQESHALEAAAAIMTMLKSQGKKPKDVDLTDLIEGWIKEKYPEECIPEHVHCLIKYVDLIVKNNEWSKAPFGEPLHCKLFIDIILLYLGGLEIENAPVVNGGPKEFLDSIATLPAGEYLFTRPDFDLKNGLNGMHSICFIITQDKEIYFYEPNEGVYIRKNIQELYIEMAINIEVFVDFSVYPQNIADLIKNFYIGMHPKLGSFLYKIKEVKT